MWARSNIAMPAAITATSQARLPTVSMTARMLESL